jgi:hypothetical protein
VVVGDHDSDRVAALPRIPAHRPCKLSRARCARLVPKYQDRSVVTRMEWPGPDRAVADQQ